MVSRVGRPREHDESTRSALLAAAEHLIGEEGPAALSARALAERCDTTTRAVYSLFGSMHGLLEALAVQLFTVIVDKLDRLPATTDPQADLIRAALDAFRHTALERPALYHLVFSRVVPNLTLGHDFTQAASAAFGRLENLVERVVIAAGRDHTIVAATAKSVHALTEGLASTELRGALGTPTQGERTWRHGLGLILAGIAAPTTPAAARPTKRKATSPAVEPLPRRSARRTR